MASAATGLRLKSWAGTSPAAVPNCQHRNSSKSVVGLASLVPNRNDEYFAVDQWEAARQASQFGTIRGISHDLRATAKESTV